MILFSVEVSDTQLSSINKSLNKAIENVKSHSRSESIHISSRETQIQAQAQIMSIHARKYLHESGVIKV